MKYMFVSDIHGDLEQLKKCIQIGQEENADKLVILGDTMNSTNEMVNYKIAELLNLIRDKLVVIRGNCDTFSFEEKLQFKILDMDQLYNNGKFVTITHGHYYNCYELPPNCGEIFIQGHTHVPMLQKQKDKILANPGSVTRPRGGDLRCYLLLSETKISLKTLESVLIKEIML